MERSRSEIDPQRLELPPGSFISITFIRLIDEGRIPTFMGYVRASLQQVASAEGVRHHSVQRIDARHYLTRTVWTSEEAMRSFRDSGAHAAAMSDVGNIADRVFSDHWIGVVIPTWKEVVQRLSAAMAQRRG